MADASQGRDVGRGCAGIAISPSQQIWTFTRGAVPVQVYTAEGAPVRSMGPGASSESRIGAPFDRQGASGSSTAGCTSCASSHQKDSYS